MKTINESEEYLQVMRRLNRCIGHLEGVRSMIVQGRETNEILMQLVAVRASLTGLSKEIMKNYIADGFVDATNKNIKEDIEKISETINQFFK